MKDYVVNTRRYFFVGTLGGRKRGAWLVDLFQTNILPHPNATLHLVTEAGEELPNVVYHTGITDEQLYYFIGSVGFMHLQVSTKALVYLTLRQCPVTPLF